MIQSSTTLEFKTSGQSLINITEDVEIFIRDSKLVSGLVNISVMHTSASIVIQENASTEVIEDLLSFFDEVAPMDNSYKHSIEGLDDMPAHIKAAITSNHICISVLDAKLILGRWQGIFLFEHRVLSQNRKVFLHAFGS